MRTMRRAGWVVLVALGTVLPAAAGDFNGDGRDDVLWRNVNDGRNTIWRSGNSATPQSVTAVSNLDWRVVGSGDYNGDGRADILWRNVNDGRNTIWRSANSATPQAVTTVSDRYWRIVGSGDYNGDGRADLLWRRAVTGANVIWLSAHSATPQAVTAVRNLDWRIASGDYDGDGRADILWRNLRTGANVIWRSANSATQQALPAVTLSWQVVGSGDYNGDGRADILWRCNSWYITPYCFGDVRIWYSANAATQGLVRAIGSWRIVGSGDYNGYGWDQILLRSCSPYPSRVKIYAYSGEMRVGSGWSIVGRDGSANDRSFVLGEDYYCFV